jgi:hypothetical protein
MKKYLIASLILISSSVFAATPVVAIVSPTSVTVDGANYGTPIDTMKNNPQLASAIQAALVVWQNQQLAAVVAAQADVTLLETQIKTQLDTATTQLTAALAAAPDDASKALVQAQLALVNSFRATAALTPDQIKAVALQTEIATSQAAAAAKQAELDALNSKLQDTKTP